MKVEAIHDTRGCLAAATLPHKPPLCEQLCNSSRIRLATLGSLLQQRTWSTIRRVKWRLGFPSCFPLVSRIGQLPVESEGFMTDNAREWMQAWRSAGVALEKVRREELRALDGRKALALLTGPANYRKEPRKPRQSSGLVEQQRWFMKARGNA